jgi:hypothetical protein
LYCIRLKTLSALSAFAYCLLPIANWYKIILPDLTSHTREKRLRDSKNRNGKLQKFQPLLAFCSLPF